MFIYNDYFWGFVPYFCVLCVRRKAKIKKSSAEFNITMLGTKIRVSDAAESIPDVYVYLKRSIFVFYP